MKKLLILIIGLSAASCLEDKTPGHSADMLFLKVDYTTNEFEGGYELTTSGNVIASDTIPVRVDYKPAGDFGNISLYHHPSDKLLFDGSIHWMGKGEIKYPQTFNAANTYAQVETSIEKPADSRFQVIFCQLPPEAIDYTTIWNAVSKLKITSEYLAGNKKVGLFFYTPSVGIGNPEDWDWFVVLSK